jgi:hypothetical protein
VTHATQQIEKKQKEAKPATKAEEPKAEEPKAEEKAKGADEETVSGSYTVSSNTNWKTKIST